MKRGRVVVKPGGAGQGAAVALVGQRDAGVAGDVVVVIGRERRGRSMLHLCNSASRSASAGVGLPVLEQGIDPSSEEGRAMFGMLSGRAELERELIATTSNGLSAARVSGRHRRRPARLSSTQAAHARTPDDPGDHAVPEIAALHL